MCVYPHTICMTLTNLLSDNTLNMHLRWGFPPLTCLHTRSRYCALITFLTLYPVNLVKYQEQNAEIEDLRSIPLFSTLHRGFWITSTRSLLSPSSARFIVCQTQLLYNGPLLMSCQLFLFEPLEVSRGYITVLIVLYWYFASAVSMNGPRELNGYIYDHHSLFKTHIAIHPQSHVSL